MIRMLVWLGCIIYCLVPDLAPGPLDDAIVLIATTGLTTMFAGTNNNNNNNNNNNSNNSNK